MRRRAVLPLLALVLCLAGLIYEPGVHTAQGASPPAAPAAQPDERSSEAPRPMWRDAGRETGHEEPVFLFNHAHAAAHADQPVPPLAVAPEPVVPHVLPGAFMPRAPPAGAAAVGHTATLRARAPPASMDP